MATLNISANNSLKYLYERLNTLREKESTKTNFKFEEAELIGRIKTLEAYPNKPIYFIEDTYSCFDAVTFNDTGNIKALIEIKNRNVASTTYDTAQFEQGKFNSMLEKQKELGAEKLIFIAHYTDNKTAVWCLDNYKDKQSVTFSSPYQTAGNTTKVIKNMVLLPISEANILLRESTDKSIN